MRSFFVAGHCSQRCFSRLTFCQPAGNGLPGQAPVMPSSGLEREQRNLRGIENGALEPEIEPVIAAPVMDHAGNLPQILVVVVDRDQQLGMVL